MSDTVYSADYTGPDRRASVGASPTGTERRVADAVVPDLKTAAVDFLAATDTGETSTSSDFSAKREALRAALGSDAKPTPEVQANLDSAAAAEKAQAEIDATAVVPDTGVVGPTPAVPVADVPTPVFSTPTESDQIAALDARLTADESAETARDSVNPS